MSDDADIIRRLSSTLYNARGWIKLLAVLSIIGGAFTALTCVGLVIAWLPIWIGIVLWKAAAKIEEAYGTSDEEALVQSLDKLRLYFTITGIMTLIFLILEAVWLIFVVVAMLAGGGMSQMNSSPPYPWK